MSETKNNLKNYILIALFSAIIAVSAFITIPSPVPFTLQALGVFCSLTVLGGKRGLLSIILYIFLGIIGLPVFAGFSGGLGHLMGATGGYILGFILTALIYCFATHFSSSSKTKAVGLVLGLIACYIFGTLWYTLLFLKEFNLQSLMNALLVCVGPFIIPDLIKIAVAILISNKLAAYKV